jgi:hypothetical protein
MGIIKKTVVQHWRYEDGWSDIPWVLRKDKNDPSREFREEVIGWHCWVYPAFDPDFEQWMDTNCPTADYTNRFNSGNPMYTVHIKDPNEMLVFSLMFTP